MFWNECRNLTISELAPREYSEGGSRARQSRNWIFLSGDQERRNTVLFVMADRCLYMGAHGGGPGMHLLRPDGQRLTSEDYLVEHYRRGEVHVDSTLAPRRSKSEYGRPGGQLLWTGSGLTRPDRRDLEYRSEECPQGQFLRHELDTGFTVISWWDRNQGDHRGGINSNIFLEGVHTSEEVVTAGLLRFHSVFENLKKAGIELVEVFLS